MSIVARPVLGVNCGTDHAYFALMDEDEAVREQEPRRYRMPEAVTGASRLLHARNDLAAELQRARPIAVAMVSPTFVRDRSPSWPDARERATIEVLIELAAAEAGIEFALITAPRIRAALNVAKGVALPAGVAAALALDPAPLYWREGRAAAAGAAIVFIRSRSKA